MKVCNFIVGCSFFIFVPSAIAGGISCLNTVDKDCNFIAKNKGDDIYIYDPKQPNPIFSIPETESSVETISFLRKNNKYMIIKESSNINKTKEILSFDNKLSEFGYLYLASDVDFDTNEKYWHGIYCSSSNISPSKFSISPLEWGFENVCEKQSETINKYKYIETDLFFTIDSRINGETGKMQLVALNAKASDNVNISNFGCLEHCPSGNGFTGKINGKYLFKMFFDINNGMIEGGYYYDKIGRNISIKGIINNGKITINVEDGDGKVREVFNGVFDGNMIQGIWENKKNNTKYPFVLYRTLS